MAKERVVFVDLAKGICITLVVFAHCCDHLNLTTPFDQFLQAFRMPLYFFLSGLFFKTYEGFLGFVKRKVNKLLIPFAFFYLTTSVLLPNMLYLCGFEVRNVANIGWLKSLMVIFDPSTRTFSNGPIWFLLCLFNINMIFYLVTIVCDKIFKDKSIYGICAFSLVVGIIGTQLHGWSFKLPLFIDTAMSALPFYVCGFFFNRYTRVLLPSQYDKYYYMSIIPAAVFIYFFSVRSHYMSNTFGNPFFVYTCGVIGTLMVIFLAKMIGTLPFFSYVGRYSIMVLVTHQLTIQFLLIVVRKFHLEEWSTCIITFVATMLMSLVVIPICIRFFPHVTAQKDVIKIN